MRPELGWRRPWQSRNKRLFPAPLGPSTTVLNPDATAKDTSWSSICPSRTNETPSTRNGRIDPNGLGLSLLTSPTRSARRSVGVAEGEIFSEIDGCIDDESEADENYPQGQSEFQVSLCGFERDGGRHHACDVRNVAPDDEHRTDLGNGAPETR